MSHNKFKNTGNISIVNDSNIRGLLQKLRVAEMIFKFLVLYGTQKFITVLLTKSCHRALFWDNWIIPLLLKPPLLQRSMLMLSYNPCRSLLNTGRVFRPGLLVSGEKREVWQEVAGQRLELQCLRERGRVTNCNSCPFIIHKHTHTHFNPYLS
jgi:hypothetical protein